MMQVDQETQGRRNKVVSAADAVQVIAAVIPSRRVGLSALALPKRSRSHWRNGFALPVNRVI